MAKAYGTVLVADRHHPMLAGIHSLLHEVFTTVVMVADDRSLLEAADRLHPDLVIVDLSMPSSDNDLNVAHRLVTDRPDLKVIVLSVHDESAAVNKTLAAGAAAYVLKRSAGTDLIPAVHEVLQGRTYVSPATRMPAVSRVNEGAV
jgi:DNA-binding NarL/FixJ family response regulator